jgi:hypothetical protein
VVFLGPNTPSICADGGSGLEVFPERKPPGCSEPPDERSPLSCPSLAAKRVSPHVLRHTCALTVLQATKDLRKVSLWLGHAHMQTTEIYTRADPSVKLETLESVMPPKLRSGRFKATDKLIESLKSLSVMQSKNRSK